MKIQSLDHLPRPACRLVSSAFGQAVRVEGLAADHLRHLFGAGGQPFRWDELQSIDALDICLETGGEKEPDGYSLDIDRADGRVSTVSGGPARVRVGPGHQLQDDRFPESLALALAQQWARAGLWVLHAAGIVVRSQGHVLLGDKGRGKSTLTALALAVGGQAVSDDWLLFGLDSDDRLCMERMRGFFMLRNGWAADRIVTGAGVGYRPHADRPKQILSTRGNLRRMPPVATVDRIWTLQRRRGWPRYSETASTSLAHTVTALIAGSMPILFSGRFPEERVRLQGVLESLSDRIEVGVLRPGLDIVDFSLGTETRLVTLLESR